MYDHLLGEVVANRASRVVIRCGGVGYECRVSLSTSSQLQVGSTCQLFTILHVVDGTPSLLGFASVAERELARSVLSVGGVGPAIALALLSVHTPDDLVSLIAGGDAAALKRVKGVGQKTSERICLELRDAMKKLGADLAGSGAAPTEASRAAEDAVAGLITLGYAEKDARSKVDKALKGGAGPGVEDLIKAVLQM